MARSPKTLAELLALNPIFYRTVELPQEELLGWFGLCDAAWVHDDDPAKPHAELTSGKCSNGFFDCLRVLKYVNLSDILAQMLAYQIRKAIGDAKVDWVIGSPMAGITFSHDVARALGAKIAMFVEKDPANPGKMIWNRMVIPADETALQIEELTTTSKTLNAVKEAVDTGNPNPVNWLPFVGILVHRPPKLPLTHYGDRRVVALIEKEVWAVDQPECKLCEKGSVRYRPKQNWPLLTGKV